MEEDVNTLESTNFQLSVQIDNLECSVDDLEKVQTGLHEQLDQFSDLRESMEEFAKETGTDIKNAVGNVNNVYRRMESLSLKNERALLMRVAADLEFMDQSEGFSREEFQRFLLRIPEHLRER